MKKLPEWLMNLAKKYTCPRCKTPINTAKIVRLGVKESYRDKGKDVLFFEYLCIDCDDVYVFELDFAPPEDLLMDMMEQGEECSFDHQENQKSGITDKEVNDLKKFMKKCKYWEDLLIEVGISKSDIKKYSKKTGNKGT